MSPRKISGGAASPLAPASSPTESSFISRSGRMVRNVPKWPTVRLGDHAETCLGKMLDQVKNKGDFFPYLGNSDVRWGRFDISNLSQMRFESHEHDRYGLKFGDLVVCEGGEPGRAAIWRDEIPNMKIQKALHRIRAKRGFDNTFLYYWFYHAGQIGALEPFFTGTTIKHLPGQALNALNVVQPPLPIQKAIAHILGSLDERIELCRRTIETLKAMARALFKDWFIDFGPVRAKMEGREQYLPDDVWSHFPDQLADSNFDEIPASWRISRLDEISDVIMGLSPSGDSYNTCGVGLPLINGPVEFGEIFPTKTKWSEAATRFAETGDLIFCVRGSTTGRRVISNGKYGIGRGVCAIRSRTNHNNFIYQLINAGIDRLLEKTTGSVFPSLNGPDIKSFQFIRPTDAIVDIFEARIHPLFDKIIESQYMIDSLSNFRDTLLPKLLSGELSVPDFQLLLEDHP